MRISLLFSAGMYVLIGSFFLFLAFQYADDTVWNPVTIILTAVATLDFGAAIRTIRLHLKIKNAQKKK